MNAPDGELERDAEFLRYRRSRFRTRLPTAARYTRSHYWLMPDGEGCWRVGWTRFATRMLGELVELGFEVEPGQSIKVGDTIGWIEGFKAVSEIYAVANGTFLGANPAFAEGVEGLASSPHDRGWLYRVEGEPEPESVDVSGYAAILNATIDRMLDEQNGPSG